MNQLEILCGDALEQLKSLPDGCAQCCVCSPPYWGLRDYGVAGQLGLEKTPQEYVAKLVAVFRELRRVLRDDGTLWLNLGDSYAGGGRGGYGDGTEKQHTNKGSLIKAPKWSETGNLKSKDLVGIPWMVAFALRDDGWVLRSEIIWQKPNPMPESVTDRPTKAHEQIFLFSKAKWCGPVPGKFAHITDSDARWLALCIDTEGCIVVKRVRQNDGGADAFGPQVTFGGTSRALVERFQSIVGHGHLAERPGKNAPMIYWQVSNNIARDFLHRIYPYLIVKQRQARIGIYVDDLVYYRGGQMPKRKERTKQENDQLLSLWARNKECNSFGNPDLSDVPEPKYGRWDSQRYYYDAEAIKEPSTQSTLERGAYGWNGKMVFDANGKESRSQPDPVEQMGERWCPEDRNKRSVWTVTTQGYREAHFATFPPDLIKPCILAGSRPGDTVIDVFGGSGTSGMVAIELGRNAILIELNPDYIELAKARCNVTPGLPLI